MTFALGSFVIIAGLLAGGIVASLVADRVDLPPAEEAMRRPPSSPPELV